MKAVFKFKYVVALTENIKGKYIYVVNRRIKTRDYLCCTLHSKRGSHFLLERCTFYFYLPVKPDAIFWWASFKTVQEYLGPVGLPCRTFKWHALVLLYAGQFLDNSEEFNPRVFLNPLWETEVLNQDNQNRLRNHFHQWFHDINQSSPLKSL